MVRHLRISFLIVFIMVFSRPVKLFSQEQEAEKTILSEQVVEEIGVQEQEQEGEIIILSDRVGEEIDAQERALYHLYPGMDDFKSAVVLRLPDSSIVFKIVHMAGDSARETVTLHPVEEKGLKTIGEYIDRVVIPDAAETAPTGQDTGSSDSLRVEEESAAGEEMSALVIPSALDEPGPHYSIQAGVVIPTGDAADAYNTGFQFGVNARFPTRNPSVLFAAGACVTMCSGKDVTKVYHESGPGWTRTTWITYGYKDAKPVTLFIGPQFGSSKYFLPAMTANFREDWKRIGIDLGAGLVVKGVVSENDLDLCVKYSILNVIGKEEGEITFAGFRILAGLIF